MDQLEAPRGVKKLHGKKSLGIAGLKLIKESRVQARKRIAFWFGGEREQSGEA